MKNSRFNSKRYIKAIDDLLELIKGENIKLQAHQNASQPSELMIMQYVDLRNHYQQELTDLIATLNQ